MAKATREGVWEGVTTAWRYIDLIISINWDDFNLILIYISNLI